jgi:prepilin-type N-terminal cleavage/methylation domain-containing protein
MNMTMNKNEAAVRGFTLIELLVVISIIGLLVALIFPTFETMKDQGRIVICKANLQALFHGFKAYAQDHQDKIAMNGGGGTAGNYDGHQGRFWVNGFLRPPTGTNCITGITTGAIYPYINDIRVYKCPSSPKSTTKDEYYRSYEMPEFLGPQAKGQLATAPQGIIKTQKVPSFSGLKLSRN